MSIILGLDVSTTITGVCVIDSSIDINDSGDHIILLDRIEFKKCNSLWEKADRVKEYLEKISHKIDKVVLEEPLMGFRPGLSSALTITTLMRFNGIVSYIARQIFDKDPEYISSSHARKLCGIKLKKTSEGGPQKEQVFDFFSKNDLKHIVWPTKKSGSMVDWSRDATDSYCIAKAAMLKV